MFPNRYFGARPFAPRYFPKVGAAPPTPELPYVGDAYVYDENTGTGSINDGAVQAPDVIYDT